jgi:GATA-binding protein
MNPTSTEHDYRFPRRPTGQSHGAPHRSRGNDEIRSSPRELNADDGATIATTTSKLLGPALFDMLRNANADNGQNQSTEQMQQDDPLATQVWKFFARTKQQLPNQDRMENLTWRMMAVSMRKHQQQMQNRYGLWMFCSNLRGSRGFLCFPADRGRWLPTKEHNAN